MRPIWPRCVRAIASHSRSKVRCAKGNPYSFHDGNSSLSPCFLPARKLYIPARRRSLTTSSNLCQFQPTSTSSSQSPSQSQSYSSPGTLPDTTPGTSSNGSTDLKAGLTDRPKKVDEESGQIDWTTSFHGLSDAPFSKEAADVLLKPLDPNDVEIKPDGIVYLPEIKYRRILNQAFGPGGWGLAPRGESTVTAKAVTREYALLVHGRLVSIARGEQDYFNPEGIPTAAEGCKSNALMRCCKDLGVASELWDPRFIRKFKTEHAKDVWAEHVVSKKKAKVWTRKGDGVAYPYKESKGFGN